MHNTRHEALQEGKERRGRLTELQPTHFLQRYSEYIL